MKKFPVLKVNMFGRAKVTYKDAPVLFGRISVTKAEKLLLILLYRGREGIARNRLLEKLYAIEAVMDAGNNLRVTCYRLKKLLVDAGLPEYDYIKVQNGIYYWSAPMDVEIDAFIFRDLIERAGKTENKKDKIVLLKQACEMYGGEFLQSLSGEDWVIMESAEYKRMYTDALEQVCEYLKECQEYEEVLRMCGPACEIYPYDEWQAVRMECYILMNRYKDAIKEYEDTSKLFFEELGVRPSSRMMQQMEAMGERMSIGPHVISDIKESLKEGKIEEGGFFCNYLSFRDEYRFIWRMMGRAEKPSYLMLCEITDGRGRPMEDAEKLNMLSGRLFSAIKHCLRRCDIFTRYNPTQFLILLMGLNGEDCGIISRRISEYFSREHKSWGGYLTFYTSSLDDEFSDFTIKRK